MKTVFKWVLITFGALLVLGLVLSVVSPEGRRGMEEGADEALSEETESPAAAVVETPEPTEEATPEPTEEATPEPTEDPLAGMTEGSMQWLSYSADRYTWVTEEFTPAHENWDTSGDDVFMTAMNSLPIWTAVLSEKTALEFVNPHECFADWHANWVEVVNTYYEGYDVLTDGGIESDMAKIEEGLALIDEANQMMPASTEAMAEAQAACAGE